MTRIAIVDYGMGNLRSVARALEHVAPEAEVRICSDAAGVRAADRVVFPGQGAMPDCMRYLEETGLREAVIEASRSKPLLGVCVGEQMLFQRSEEGPADGLGLFDGQVVRFAGPAFEGPERLKVPHMGWNRVRQTLSHPLRGGRGRRYLFLLRAQLLCGARRSRGNCRSIRLRGRLYLRRSQG